MAIFHLHLNHHQPSNGPIRAKHITQCSSVIGQYDKVSGGVIRVSQIRPYLRHVHWTCVHRVCSWTLGGVTSLRWGSLLNIETFASFNSTCVLPNIWPEQSVCTSLNEKVPGKFSLIQTWEKKVALLFDNFWDKQYWDGRVPKCQLFFPQVRVYSLRGSNICPDYRI